VNDACPSKTALRVAIHRAAHQVLDVPPVFEDPLALRLLDADHDPALRPGLEGAAAGRLSRVLRASIAARSRFAEDELRVAVSRGVRQYVVLGAGLDTFAFRNPYAGHELHVFEVDHPATQAWKRARLQEAGIAIPPTVTFTPVNFETQALEDGLSQAGFDGSAGTLFSWLGVTPYLCLPAIDATLQFASSMPPGSGIVFDHAVSPSLLGPAARLAFDRLAHRVALAGEPFRTFFDPSSLATRLGTLGFREIEDLGPEEMNARYFAGRRDGLRVGTLTHTVHAKV
jgi:methyltransferase (TIGR00027 family)